MRRRDGTRGAVHAEPRRHDHAAPSCRCRRPRWRRSAIATDATWNTAGTAHDDGSRTWDLARPARERCRPACSRSRRPTGDVVARRTSRRATYAATLAAGSDLLGVFLVDATGVTLLGVVSPTGGTLKTELDVRPARARSSRCRSWRARPGSSTSTVTGYAQGVFGTYTEKYDSRVDQVGTMTTPYGDFPVLRVATDLTRTSGFTTLLTKRSSRGSPSASARSRPFIAGLRDQHRVQRRRRGAEARAVRAAALRARLRSALRRLSRAFHAGPLPGAPADATFVDVDGVHVHYREAGAGPAVVLIHGYGASLESWGGVLPVLASDHRVIAIDLKGFGWTSRPDGDYSPAAQAQLVWRVLDKLGVTDVAIVGHSWGTSVALSMAVAHPERTRQRRAVRRVRLRRAGAELLPLGAELSGLGELLFGLFYTERIEDRAPLAYYDERWVTQARVERVEARHGRGPAPSRRRSRSRAAITSPRCTSSSRAFDKPVLLLWGADDQVTPLAFGHRLAERARERRAEGLSALRAHPDGRGAQRVDPRPRRIPCRGAADDHDSDTDSRRRSGSRWRSR